jgi:hypothetical protein
MTKAKEESEGRVIPLLQEASSCKRYAKELLYPLYLLPDVRWDHWVLV